MSTTTHTTIETTLGELTLVAREGTLAGIYFPGHWTKPDRTRWGAHVSGGFEQAARELREYLAGERTTFEVATVADGDAFQARVWERIAAIPYGETTTYGSIARALGDPALARRVGGAVGANPLSLIIPCHRVVGKGGKLTGYAGGLERKRALLALEGAVVLAPREPAATSLF